jgi:hypothetical protein
MSSSTGLPALPNARQIGGTVYTTKDNQRQALGGCVGGLEMSMDTVVADTVTDSQGRYRLCGLPTDRVSGLYAVKVGTLAPVYTEVAAGGDQRSISRCHRRRDRATDYSAATIPET